MISQAFALDAKECHSGQNGRARENPDVDEEMPEVIVECRRVLQPEDVPVSCSRYGIQKEGHRHDQQELECDLWPMS
jgi:hypothetical protein